MPGKPGAVLNNKRIQMRMALQARGRVLDASCGMVSQKTALFSGIFDYWDLGVSRVVCVSRVVVDG
jgi:hypothetical protein